jgi:SAM-dependent methyltransferase
MVAPVANVEQRRIWNETNAPRFFAIRDPLERSLAPFGLAAMDALAPAPGESALDVGCGFGTTSRELARRVGPSGRVLGMDICEPFIAAAGAKPLPNVQYLCEDAQTHVFEPVFDICFSRFGVMFFEDPPAAFASLCRALRPGGRFAAVVWGAPEQNVWVEIQLRVLRGHLPIPPTVVTAVPGPFSLADPLAFQRLLARAGFADPRVRPLHLPYVAGATVEDSARLLLQLGPSATVLREAGEAAERLRPVIVADLCEALVPWAGPRGIELPATALLACAAREVGAREGLSAHSR